MNVKGSGTEVMRETQQGSDRESDDRSHKTCIKQSLWYGRDFESSLGGRFGGIIFTWFGTWAVGEDGKSWIHSLMKIFHKLDGSVRTNLECFVEIYRKGRKI